ncbi:uncharacterized protein PODANS_1_12260 [Podospora anserina S mat+]|uniref:Podospora anserina S mat+ genomic DNA chromosome 1, supercontig 2 n=2 Tax=Podospora TaxID=5144 RepID=B2AYU4_PODAN|nr:uncharacterized protein PODANS_1_12260 [Podospora anserina S mat+]KAK4659659.1 protein phosphatase regulator [Podospora pseudocomata]CAP69568.1 unnamed protein product [Podospora anserina S mat+]CDP23584.1 Putative protein of unknown function [Podospora anserina S mat+]
MAVVISSEENNYFSASTLRRSHSQPKFVTKNSGFHTSSSTSRLADLYPESTRSYSSSSVSSTPSSPRIIRIDSSDQLRSTKSGTKFSLVSGCEEVRNAESVTSEDDIIFPQYEERGGYFGRIEVSEPAPSPQAGYSYTSSPNDDENSAATSRPGTPDISERAEDDISLKVRPSRHVDYLSHNWREEDIWSSWKLIVSRRGDYSDSARLENASWRTWMKAKNKLSTVSPETLNWLKDCDVTWLYGPLQSGASMSNPRLKNSSSRLSKSTPQEKKKTILKKRTMSEIMLQRSLSTSSLVKQAAAAVQAQQKGGLKRGGQRPGLERATTDFVGFPFSSRGVSHDGTSLFPSTRSSGITSPFNEKKHIHFNEQVEQCIAVEIKGDDDEDDEPVRYDSDSDDGAIMMKRSAIKKRRPTMRRAASHAGNMESKTIAMLPSTTLKYRDDTPEPTETAMKHSTGIYKNSPVSPSSSQETLRPSKKSGKLFFASDDDDDDVSDDDDDEPVRFSSKSTSASTSSSLGASFGEGGSGLRRSTSTSSLSAEPVGMRRTSSGMFMPYEEGDSESSSGTGLIGRVIDTVNTARDIVHVIWNVGWRK